MTKRRVKLLDAKRVVALLAFGAALGAALFFVLRQRAMGGSAKTRATPSKGLSQRDPSVCGRLVARYAEALNKQRACAVDDDCVVEARTGLFATLDGCYRITRRAASLEGANQLADAWLDASCVEDLPGCERAPLAVCRKGQCVERAPPGVPDDWRRERVPGLITMFLPPDLRRIPARGEDSLILSYQSAGRTLHLVFGEYAPTGFGASTPDTATLDQPGEWESVNVADRKVLLVRERSVQLHAPRRWTARAKVPEVASPLRALTPSADALYFTLECESRSACDAAPLILSTIELLTEALRAPSQAVPAMTGKVR